MERLIQFFDKFEIDFESVEQAMSEYLTIRERYRSDKNYEIADEMRNKALEVGIKIEDGNKDGWSWNNS